MTAHVRRLSKLKDWAVSMSALAVGVILGALIPAEYDQIVQVVGSAAFVLLVALLVGTGVRTLWKRRAEIF